MQYAPLVARITDAIRFTVRSTTELWLISTINRASFVYRLLLEHALRKDNSQSWSFQRSIKVHS